MKRVLLICLAYPDPRMDSNMYSDLAESFACRRLDITVLAPTTSLLSPIYSYANGIRYIRLPIPYMFSSNNTLKAISNLLLPLLFSPLLILICLLWPPAVVIYPTPPVTLSPLVCLARIFSSAKTFLILRDIFPQNAVDLGLFKRPSTTYHLFRSLESLLYSVSDTIGCMSPANATYLTSNNTLSSSCSLTYLPNWFNYTSVCSSTFSVAEHLHLDSSKHHFVIGGNIGVPQQPWFILELASYLKDVPNLIFTFIGNGTLYASLREVSQQFGFDNIQFLPSQTRTGFHHLLRQAYAGMILLNKDFTVPNIPSRLLGYWAAALPIVAATDPFTDLNSKFIKPSRSGLWSEMGDVQACAENILFLLNNPLLAREMGNNGFKYLSKFSSDSTVSSILKTVG
jgi:glycosyltransferase involved in cell wall biosynthesis